MTHDPSHDGHEPYLTVEEAARFVRLSVKTLAKLRVSGGGPRFIKAGIGRRAKVLYRRTDLDDWLASLSFASTSEYHR
ncbi:helix-turn-helix domain-containing protein [uncultured Hyphomicrobium sp.]|jgi:excisionase family DNA binding protein|uniref:helix-turn-helix domain-containing protein n=1 Tax=uncultured Hyphomicrobium sp. TaxID=194373 RepID=UPI0025FFF966|nr:helix-turn-helix domain-containing protein [uncultured Hyphomicrobium sp.]